MVKVIKNLGLFCGIVAVSWWLGGMMYFVQVAKHFRDKEYHENAGKNIASNTAGSSDRTSGDTPKPTAGNIERKGYSRNIPAEIPWARGSENNKWRSYYQPSAGRNPGGLRPGETGWDN